MSCTIVSGLPVGGRDAVGMMAESAVSLGEYFSFGSVSEATVRDTISALKNSNARDVYGLSTNLLKYGVSAFIAPLTELVNCCIREGAFPDCLKIGVVVPTFKKGDADDMNNYRPITLLPVVSKVLEKILCGQLLLHFETNSLFGPCQFGFRRGRSTADAVMKLVGTVLRGFENGNYVGVAFLDLSKAFDCVAHEVLLRKLYCYNLYPDAVGLLSSYLSGRLQCVAHDGARSGLLPVSAGVPQGSILGPLLFLIFINDISSLEQDLILFADDTSVCCSAGDLVSLESGLTAATSNVGEWFVNNRLKENTEKTTKLIFSNKREGKALASARFLGVILDDGLRWDEHCVYLSKKLNSTIFLMRNLRSEVSLPVLRQAYFALFGSYISYGLMAWGASAGSSRVFSLQRKVLRIMTGLAYTADCRAHFKQLKIMTLPAMHIYECLKYVHGRRNEYTKHADIHDHNTRGRDALVLPVVRLTRTVNCGEALAVKLYNALPGRFKEMNILKFKMEIKTELVEAAIYSTREYFNCVKDFR